MNEPITTKKNGLFQPGNRAAVGHSTRSQKLRNAILHSISREDVQAITAKLIEQARAGDQAAAKLLLGYIGKPVEGPQVAIQVNSPETPGAGRETAMRIIARIQAERGTGGES
jgi:hypothetical protein